MFRYRKYIYEVYKHKSFSKAAEALHISQPSLSFTIKKAEEELGIRIFDRGFSPIKLTDEGIKYIDAVKKIIEIEERYANELNVNDSDLQGEVSFMTNHIYATQVFPHIIDEYNKRFPKVKVFMTEGSISQEKSGMSLGEIDFSVDNDNSPNELYSRTLLTKERTYLCGKREMISKHISEKYLFSAKEIPDATIKNKGISLTDFAPLSGLPFILLTPGNNMRNKADAMFEQAGISIDPLIQVVQMATAYVLSERIDALTFASDTLIKNIPLDSLFFCPIDTELAVNDIVCSTKRNRYLTRPAKEFLSLTATGFRQLIPNSITDF